MVRAHTREQMLSHSFKRCTHSVSQAPDTGDSVANMTSFPIRLIVTLATSRGCSENPAPLGPQCILIILFFICGGSEKE